MELVETNMEFLVYLYDDFTQPLSAAGLGGTIALADPAAKAQGITVSLPLSPTRAQDCLSAAKPTTLTATEATLTVTIGGETLEMTFPRPRHEPHA